MKHRLFYEFCHALSIEEEYYIDKNEGISIAYHIEGLNLYVSDHHHKQSIQDHLANYLAALDPLLHLTFYCFQTYQAAPTSPVQKEESTYNSLKAEREKHLSEAHIKKTMTIILSIGKKSSKTSFPEHIYPSLHTLYKHKALLQDKKKHLEHVFEQLNISYKAYTTRDWTSFFHHIGIRHDTLMELNPYTPLNEQLCSESVHHDAHSLRIQKKQITSCSLQSHKQRISSWFMVHNSLDLPIGLSYYVSFKKSPHYIQRIQHRKRLHALLRKCGFSEYSEQRHETLESEYNSIINRLSNDDSLIDVSMNFLIQESNPDTLEKNTQRLIHYCYEKCGLIIKENHFTHLHHYCSFFPNQQYFNPKKISIFPDQATYFIPIGDSFRGFGKGDITFDTSRKTRFPFSFIDHKAPAGHALIVGGTGGGKSFFMSWILTQIIQSRNDALISIIDMGGSYQNICNEFGGNYINIAINKQYALQLFPKKQDIFTNNHIDPDQLIFLAQYIKLLIADSEKSNFSKHEEHLINMAILDMYASKNSPLLCDFIQALSSLDSAGNSSITRFKNALQLYTNKNEPLSCLFNHHDTISIDHPFIVFDITRLKEYPQIAELYLQVISNTLRLRMFKGDSHNTKQLIIRDEVWSLFSQKTASNYIQEEYRTARKYRTILISLSQLISDYTSTNTNAVLKNSYTTFILQNMEKRDDLQALGLNKEEAKLASQVKRYGTQYADIFMKYADIGSEVIRINPTPIEFDICSRKTSS
ncbi:hypothetical protein DID78_05785 [Candidatus Marinamargulisbacteria bacterium SCGC AG-343-D04]|nr:hypothetical protein DID78_05785 [Candidatus Marinamargulisbacteria bacterium SCGC AG-343-D04]